MTREELLEKLHAETDGDMQQICDALCDGEALTALGVTDEDTELVTDLYAELAYKDGKKIH